MYRLLSEKHIPFAAAAVIVATTAKSGTIATITEK
jgi:hypothetical protein